MHTTEPDRSLRQLLDKAIELDWEVEIVEEASPTPQIRRTEEGDPIGNPPYRQHVWC